MVGSSLCGWTARVLLTSGAIASAAVPATLPSTAEVRDAAYVGANGGVCGERPCARDPNVAQVRNVECRRTDEPDAAVCDYEIRIGDDGRWERVSDTLLRDRADGSWYLDDEDDDDDARKRR